MIFSAKKCMFCKELLSFFHQWEFSKSIKQKNSKNNKMKKPDPDAETCPNTATLINTLNTNLETQLCLYFFIYKSALSTFPWFYRVPQSKVEANRTRGSWVMIGHTQKQTEIITLHHRYIICKNATQPVICWFPAERSQIVVIRHDRKPQLVTIIWNLKVLIIKSNLIFL